MERNRALEVDELADLGCGSLGYSRVAADLSVHVYRCGGISEIRISHDLLSEVGDSNTGGEVEVLFTLRSV